MVDPISIVILASSALSSFIVGKVIGGWGVGSKVEELPVREKKCTGYVVGKGRVTKSDCKGVRSHVCLDGRCSYHCNEMCKCASPEGLR